MPTTLSSVLSYTSLAAIELANPLVIYIASLVGAIALYLMMPKKRFNWTIIGAILGAASLGVLWVLLSKLLPWADLGISKTAFVYYYIFSAIAIVSAVRVITHTKPIYSALWFVMVVLSSAGLFIVLSAQFMAFAMVIIYGGAILVTYMFVIMLASHAGDPLHEDEDAEYDKVAREPIFAIAASFLLMAVLLNVWFVPAENSKAPQIGNTAVALSDEAIITDYLSNRPLTAVEKAQSSSNSTDAVINLDESTKPAIRPLTNTERIGLNLFSGHPLALELAGVILLISLIGAVVIARTQVPDEDKLKA